MMGTRIRTPDYSREGMSVLVHQPTGRLQGVVERLWYVEGPACGEQDVICPDGRSEMVLHLGDPMRERGPTAAAQPRHLLVGQMDRPMTVAPTGRVAMIGATFEAGALHRLLPAPQDRLAGSVVDLEAVWGRWTRETADQVAAAPSPTVAAARFADALGTLLPDASEPRDAAAIRASVAAFRRTGGRASVSRLARAMGVSRRQFERRFREQVGLPPRLFARIVRFQRAFGALGHETGASIAARCGFSDQAHLVREVRRFSGRTPTLLAKADGLTAFFRG
jgi:AraC-like DNA-binding protein